MEKKFNPSSQEPLIRRKRSEEDIYGFDKDTKKEIFSIDTPPPTISWSLHMWHIWSYTHTDVVARIKRMIGYEVFYPIGFDDNWLPTERLVEKELWKTLDTENYIEQSNLLIEKYREQYKSIREQLWLSVDWKLSYSTISDLAKRISQKSFLELYEKWLIYNTSSPALWCPETQTTISQADLEDVEVPSEYHEIVFKVSNNEFLNIATTRPELLPSCVAVFIHPDDSRYNKFIGKDIVTPLWNKVKIIWDNQVKIDKWTWVVMCCTYWDEMDLYRVKKYWLSEKIIISKDGKITNTWIEYLDGNLVESARKNIIEQLSLQWSLIKSTPIVHSVKVHDRTWKPIELIPVEQRFISIMPHKEELIEMADKINRHPEYMKKRYVDRVKNLQRDWNISRSRKYGIPFPLWISSKDWKIITANKDELPVDPRLDKPNLKTFNEDISDIKPVDFVLDTRATSSSTIDIIKKLWEEDDLANRIWIINYRPQAHDIIRTWWFYTVVKSFFQHQEIPFQDIAISWHVLWKGKTKLSKSKDSKENWPEFYLSEYWADALRYRATWWTLWKDIVLDQDEIVQWKKLINKLRNSARFTDIQLKDYEDIEIPFQELYAVDRWILTRLHQIKEKVYIFNNDFDIGESRTLLVRFFRDEFCNLYLEMIKDIIYKPEEFIDWNNRKSSSQYALKKCMQEIIKLFAPYLPYVTEELYKNDNIFSNKESNSIHRSSYPVLEKEDSDEKFISESWKSRIVFNLIDSIWAYKSANNLSIWAPLDKITIKTQKENISILDEFLENIKSIANSKSIDIAYLDDWDKRDFQLIIF